MISYAVEFWTLFILIEKSIKQLNSSTRRSFYRIVGLWKVEKKKDMLNFIAFFGKFFSVFKAFKNLQMVPGEK